MRTICLSVVISLLFFSCGQKNSVIQEPDPKVVAMLSGDWFGELPCADCAGISYKITLNSDMTYTDVSVYRGKDENPFFESGTWDLLSDSTFSLSGSERKFLLRGNELIIRDMEGRRIESGFSEMYHLRKVVVEENPDIYKRKFDEGIDFTARGNEPFWSLDIDLDMQIIFTSLTDIAKLNTPIVAGIKTDDGKNIVYNSTTEAGELKITITESTCSDNMSAEQFTHTVKVQVKLPVDNQFTEFNGCGKYLMDLRLNDIWVMQEMTSVVLKKEELNKGLPTFEFNLKDNRFSGHAGCNQMTGSINVEGNKIKFGAIASTKMACPNMRVEHAVASALSGKQIVYKLENLKLTLIAEEGVKMVFKKVD